MTKRAQVSPLMDALSAYMAGAQKRALPPSVAERGKLHLVDTVAAIISGSRLTPGRRAVSYAKMLGGVREAGIMGTRLVTSAVNAALANGMCGHADETDDSHTPTRSHPGTNVVPAAFAIGERQALSGKQLLRAVVLGYELGPRMVYALGAKQFFLSGHHASCFGGLFGATAAAASLLRLNAIKMRYALAYAAEHASGLYTMLRDTQHVEKAYGLGGMPAQHGVTSALLVASGCTGVEDVLSGKPSFFSIFAKAPDTAALTRGLGRDYELMHTRMKRWPTGGPTQGPLQVLSELMREHGFRARDVAKLVVRSPASNLMVVNDREMPSISLQHLLALMLIDGRLTFASIHSSARMKDPAIVDMRTRISAVADTRMEGQVRDWNCEIKVTLKDGRKLAHKTVPVDPKLGFPLSRRDVHDKAIDLLAPVLGRKRGETLIAKLLDIEQVEDVRVLRRLYTPPP